MLVISHGNCRLLFVVLRKYLYREGGDFWTDGTQRIFKHKILLIKLQTLGTFINGLFATGIVQRVLAFQPELRIQPSSCSREMC